MGAEPAAVVFIAAESWLIAMPICQRSEQNLLSQSKFENRSQIYQAGNLLCGLQQFSAGVFFRCPFYVSDFRRNFRLTGGEIRDPMISGLSKIYIGTVSGTDISIWGCF